LIEAQSRGTLVSSESYHNNYVFVLALRDGKIAALAEHFDPRIVDAKIVPLIQAAIAKLAPAV
jgi:ketosteroid isomerase-like protein